MGDQWFTQALSYRQSVCNELREKDVLFWYGERPEACGEEEFLNSLKKRTTIKMSFSAR
ncbi:hypothetical protein KSX_70690 [Ktedonospora formicarum]|uniref:Uncharacterized protein n=1 Tax=Ktedonospora formicarum TaxID=2778364 RepID=A0A8J3I589_9CHLR|nr:hypothetical protein KSX_70690 [Ktedonospora formicarum]